MVISLTDLPIQYQGKPVIEALVSAILSEISKIKAGVDTLNEISILQNASGVFLTQWESTVGAEYARNLTDQERRVIVLAQGAANCSDCSPPAIAQLLSILGQWLRVEYFHRGYISILGDIPPFPSVSLLLDLIKRSLSPGIGIDSVWLTGYLIEDISLRSLFLDSWELLGGASASKSDGVLTITGPTGARVLGGILAEEGATLNISGKYRGTAGIFAFDDGGLIQIFEGPQEDWTDFSFSFVVGADHLEIESGTNPFYVEIKDLSAQIVDPEGAITRNNRDFRLIWGGGVTTGSPQIDLNGFASVTLPDPDPTMTGGFFAHRRSTL